MQDEHSEADMMDRQAEEGEYALGAFEPAGEWPEYGKLEEGDDEESQERGAMYLLLLFS